MARTAVPRAPHAPGHAGPRRIARWPSGGPGKAKEREEGVLRRRREEGFYAADAKKGSLPLTSHAESGYARMPGSS